MKFGGTSVSSAALWQRIVEQVRAASEQGEKVLVVVSAIDGITDRAQQFIDAPGAELAAELRTYITGRHLDLVQSMDLAIDETQQRWLDELEALTDNHDQFADPARQARLMALGEMLSSSLGACALRQAGLEAAWVDARELLTADTDNHGSRRSQYLRAHCHHECEPGMADRLPSRVCITQGYVAANADGQTVVLGRGGSDTSGAYLAARLKADRLEISTDVPGMFSANPRQIPGARLLNHLGYREAQELASMGARVLHPRCLGPLREHGIALHIRQTDRPEVAGTLISAHARDFGAQVKAIVYRKHITLIAMEGLRMWHQVGFLAEAFAAFSRHGLSVDLVSTSESNVTASLDLDEHLLEPHTLDDLIEELSGICRVKVMHECASVSLVGLGIRTILHRLGPALEIFEQRRIHLVSQASNDLNLTFVVDQADAEKLVRQLHQTLIPGGVGGDSVFGPTWEQLFRREAAGDRQPIWWRQHREPLLGLMDGRDAAFVYHRESLRKAAGRLTSMTSVDRVFYAMKANPHPGIVQELAAQGLGIECVSLEEIKAAREAVPELPADSILFTPNFAARAEYRQALEAGVMVTIDNLYVLEHWGEDFRDREVLIRLDPGSGLGHHKLVRTAGRNSKFGVPAEDLAALKERVAEHRIRVVGLHAHTGSGILHPDAWHRTLEVLSGVAKEFEHLRIIDLGGGLGVPDKQDELPLDTQALDQGLARLRKSLPKDLQIWIEPGRYLVAEAGVLLARVTQTKGKDEVQYVGVATGMNSLIRPALYGAYHEIHNLSRLDEIPDRICNVVGPICETGDVLGLDRLLPSCQEGDLLLIANTGAYGRAMASSYNLRQPAPELMLDQS
jgi:diaminopimelate decarboxylase/aspartate kinase